MSAGLAATYPIPFLLCELPFSLRKPGPFLGTQSPCSPFYLFFAGFPGLQGPAGPPGAPGLSLPSVTAGQPGDPGQPGLDGERGKDRKPKRGLAIAFSLEFGEVPMQLSPIPIARDAWACSPQQGCGVWDRLHFARRVWEELGTGTPKAVR